MELITILSTIILIATISTFILSIGAYILYKIRSRRESAPMINNVGPTKAELVTVQVQDNFEELRQTVAKANLNRIQTNDKKEKPVPERVVSSKYVKYSSERYSSDRDRSAGDLQWR